MKLSSFLIAFAVAGTFLIAAITAAIAFGGPKPPPAMASINNPFKAVDFSDLPPLLHFAAADGASLAYRHYSPTRAVWLLPFALAVLNSAYMPRAIGYLILAAGVAYSCAALSYILLPQFRSIVGLASFSVAAVGELSAIAWLLAKGIRRGEA